MHSLQFYVSFCCYQDNGSNFMEKLFILQNSLDLASFDKKKNARKMLSCFGLHNGYTSNLCVNKVVVHVFC